MSNRKVQIEIESTIDPKGIDQANKGIDTLGKTADQASGMIGKVSSAMGQAGPATSRLSSALGALGQVARGLQGGLAGLATILVGLAVNAIVKFTQATKEAEKAIDDYNKAVAESNKEAALQKIDQSITARHKLRDALNEEASAVQRLSTAYAAVESAQKAADLADIDLAEQTDLANIGAGPRADIKRAQIQAKYAAQRRDTSRQYETMAIDRQYKMADTQVSLAETQRRNTQQSLTEDTSKKEKLEQQLSRLYAQSRYLRGGGAPRTREWIGYGNTGQYIDVIDTKEQARLVEANQQATAKVTAQLEAYRKQIEISTETLKKADEDIELLRLNRTAIEIRAESYSRTQPQLDTLADKADQTSITRQRYQQDLQDLRTRASRTRSTLDTHATTYRAESDAYNPIRADYRRQSDWNAAQQKDRTLEADARKYHRLSQSAQKLEQQLQSLNPEQLATSFDHIARQLARLERAIANANNRSKQTR